MWLACYTQDEIAAAVDRSQQSITEEIATFTDFGSVSKTGKSRAFHSEPDFKPPLYNVWTFAQKTETLATIIQTDKSCKTRAFHSEPGAGAT